MAEIKDRFTEGGGFRITPTVLVQMIDAHLKKKKNFLLKKLAKKKSKDKEEKLSPKVWNK